VLKLIIHESMHFLIRRYSEDGGKLTPKNKHQIEEYQTLEAGYLLETIVFGSCKFKYWESKNLLVKESWDKISFGMFSNEDFERMAKETKKNFNASGLCLDEIDICL
jgi:hypothetical protein